MDVQMAKTTEYIYPFNLLIEKTSLSQLAKYMNKSRSHIHRLATGKHVTGAKILSEVKQACEAMQVEINEDWKPVTHKTLTYEEFCNTVESMQNWANSIEERISNLERQFEDDTK